VVLDRYAGSWFIGDSPNTAIVSVMVEEKGRQTADKKEGRKPWTLREFGGKTLWDWLQLLIVPVVLSLITVAFALWQDLRQEQVDVRRTEQAEKIENQRARAERALAVQRAQDEALQAYLSQMSSLLLERGLRDADKDSEVSTLARARTVTVLQRLDADRNQTVIRFLTEARLIGTSIGLLVEADLQGADLEGSDLRDADLSGADLNRADLSGADLSKTDLRNALLRNAHLNYADLTGGADLSFANLSFANLSDAHLNDADLSGTFLFNADLSDADLSGTTLTGGTHLNDANLKNANLRNAKMDEDDIHDMVREAKTLEGATMPNRQKYEEWLKDKEARKEDVENE
jgi:uncharacterized protein YjbI with pentapeptide repeats